MNLPREDHSGSDTRAAGQESTMADTMHDPASGDRHARKFDQGKPRWSLFVWDAAEVVVRVLEYGAQKYAPRSWVAVPDGHERYLNAAVRHLVARMGGEVVDPESGLPHLGHAACSVLFALSLELRAARDEAAP